MGWCIHQGEEWHTLVCNQNNSREGHQVGQLRRGMSKRRYNIWTFCNNRYFTSHNAFDYLIRRGTYTSPHLNSSGMCTWLIKLLTISLTNNQLKGLYIWSRLLFIVTQTKIDRNSQNLEPSTHLVSQPRIKMNEYLGFIHWHGVKGLGTKTNISQCPNFTFFIEYEMATWRISKLINAYIFQNLFGALHP